MHIRTTVPSPPPRPAAAHPLRAAPVGRLEACHLRCAVAGVSFSVRRKNSMCIKVLKRMSLLRHHGPPMMARLQLPDPTFLLCRAVSWGHRYALGDKRDEENLH